MEYSRSIYQALLGRCMFFLPKRYKESKMILEFTGLKLPEFIRFEFCHQIKAEEQVFVLSLVRSKSG